MLKTSRTTKRTCPSKNTGLSLISDRDKFPSSVKWIDELKGICIGGCVMSKRGQDEFGKPWKDVLLAHAHTDIDHSSYGWICSPFRSILKSKWLLLHEVAHIIAWRSEYHDDRWRETILTIGGSLEQKRFMGKRALMSYVKKPRKS